ncbi:MAG: hypothetical protein ACREDR_10140, partial [Blastocatellia bacterium]
MSGAKSVVPRRESGPQADDRLRAGMYQSDVEQILGTLNRIAAGLDAQRQDSTVDQALRAIGAKLEAHTDAIHKLVGALQQTNSAVCRTSDAAASIPALAERAIESSVLPPLKAILAQVVDAKARVERIPSEVSTAIAKALTQSQAAPTPHAPQPPRGDQNSPAANNPPIQLGSTLPRNESALQSPAEPKAAAPLPAAVVELITRDLHAITTLLPKNELAEVPPDDHTRAITDLQKLRDTLPRENGVTPRWIRERLKDIHRAIANKKWVAARTGIDELLRNIRRAVDPQSSPEGSLPTGSRSEAEWLKPHRPGAGGEPSAGLPSDRRGNTPAEMLSARPRENSPEGSLTKGTPPPPRAQEPKPKTGGVGDPVRANPARDRQHNERPTPEGNAPQNPPPARRDAALGPGGLRNNEPNSPRTKPGGVPTSGGDAGPAVDPHLEQITGGLV